jgi:hypothetical protein
MNKRQQLTMFKLELECHESGAKKRTLKDTLLISAWIVAYAGVLFVFRGAKAVESVLSNRP